MTVLQSRRKVSDGTGYIISMRVGWDSEIIREERNGGCCAFSSSCRDITPEIAVVERCMADIPTFDSMLCPGATLGGCFINEHFYTRWRHGCGIVIKNSVKMVEC